MVPTLFQGAPHFGGANFYRGTPVSISIYLIVQRFVSCFKFHYNGIPFNVKGELLEGSLATSDHAELGLITKLLWVLKIKVASVYQINNF